MNLPLTRLIMFKHGVGYFERRGAYTGEQLALSVPHEAMDDLLKSLVALDLGAGQVLGVAFETPEDQAARLARGSIKLSDQLSLLDLLRDLRGRQVRLRVTTGEKKTAETSYEGLVVGVDYESEEPLQRAQVSLYVPETRQVVTLSLKRLVQLELLDDAAASDLSYFLRAAQSDEQRRVATVRLSPGDHDLLVGYIAPAPAWRVSYRLLYEGTPADYQGGAGASDAFVLLQGWGLFDNQLEEDLEGVELTLMAGMPVSFRYRLYEPHTPERPLVEDEERTVAAPIMFEPPMPAMGMVSYMDDGMATGREPMPMAAMRSSPKLQADRLEASVQSAATGDERGALFAYHVAHPVSVGRGQSAMVPIVSQRLPARRELLYNGAKQPRHPVASLRLTNATGLTLERGPATILEDGDYAGEAVLPFTRVGGELIVAYAVELGIAVEERRRSNRQLIGISIKDEYAVFEEHDLAMTTYQITNNGDQETDVTLDHGLMQDYEVAGPRQPDETSAGYGRWRVACAPHTLTSFEVTERRLVRRQERVRGLTGAQLRSFLRDRLLTAEVVQALGAVLTLYQQADQAQAQIRQLEQEREKIGQHQRQIQGNLQPLGREGDEGALRQRYVATLNQQEDRLVAIASESERLQAEIKRLEGQALAQLKQMNA
ncbi:hypothetical protein [Candidatus Chloroploca sp. Khr17]|uniref:hypothetical protein n=1 Tax=Candidatus Chloroploca sp. Khr17 TaxID=2496869 RepID=UPI00101B9460|nr:hypothetical protein [Candidatus Chloroploca sp. Khr17]